MRKILATLGLLTAACAATLEAQYPFMLWSSTCVPAFEEFDAQVSSQSLVERVHGALSDGKASRLFLIRKEGLTTRDVLRSARDLNFDRETMFQHALAFPYVDTQGLTDDALLAQALGVTPSQHHINSVEEVPALAAELAADTDASVLKVAIINVKQSLGNEILNTISEQVQSSVKAAGAISSYAMAIAGRAGVAEPFVSLQQTDSVSFPVLSTTTPVAAGTPQETGKYLYPNTLTAILAMLFVVIIMIIAFLLLMDVQTPTYFPTAKIDFGKIEK